ncbi:MFS transporter [Tessaracoccus coleopterorum]|uniref:MFS transporter n=1 Tax=Tessaracoccus coleopterorum TaxID=2714950 RepID=UPI0018D3C354|nr:MFS transporter [Tessaracoccus coleopterorum]
MLIVFGALDPLTRQGQWLAFFSVIGVVTTLVGVVAALWLRDAAEPRATGSYLSTLMAGLRPSSVRANPGLYVTLAAWAVLGTSTQVFLPYLIIYVQRYLRIEGYPIVLASVLLGAALLSVLGGRVLDRIGAERAIVPVAAWYGIGLVAMFFARGMLPVIGAGIVMMSGFMLGAAALSATVRNFTPPHRAGEVQGLRMIAMVLIPMVLGPFIGALVIRGADETYVDLGVTRQVPTPWIFIAAAVVVAFIVIPAAFVRRHRLVKETV